MPSHSPSYQPHDLASGRDSASGNVRFETEHASSPTYAPNSKPSPSERFIQILVVYPKDTDFILYALDMEGCVWQYIPSRNDRSQHAVWAPLTTYRKRFNR